MLKLPEASPVLTVVKLSSDATLPSKANEAAVGFDLFSAEDSFIAQESIVVLGTGIRATPPSGYYMRITGRSGLSSSGYIVLPGVCDPDYTGEIKIMMMNFNKWGCQIHKGDKIAQMVPEKYAPNCTVVVMDQTAMAATDALQLATGGRGDRGFGSTGVRF